MTDRRIKLSPVDLGIVVASAFMAGVIAGYAFFDAAHLGGWL